MSTNATPKPCRKCNGTGFLIFAAHVDGGRCWACLPSPAPLTPDQVADDAAFALELEFRSTFRTAERRTVRALMAEGATLADAMRTVRG